MTGAAADAGPRPATGLQFQLRHGDVAAVIGQVAAVLREFSVGSTHYTERWPDDQVPPMGCGIVLMPWPNRVAGGRWTHDDVELQLDITEPARGHAIHGLLRNTPYQPVKVADDAVTLSAPIYPQHGYPFTLDTAVTYALADVGLRVTHRVTNVGQRPAPFGVGAHPYLRVGDVPIEDLVISVPGASYAPTDQAMIPTGIEPVNGSGRDLRGGVRLGDLSVDAALTDLAASGGRVTHRLTAPDGGGVELWADEVFGWAQVYTPRDFPGHGPGRRLAVAIEPMTCGVNALNTGRDLLVVQPGETWTACWGLSPF